MKKIVLSLILAMTMMLGLVGCKKEGGADASAIDSAYPNAVDVLTAAWNQVDEQFPTMGGSMNQIVDNAPGTVSLSDADMMTYTLLIPAEVQSNLADAASLVHMMNANTFTGVALKVHDMAPADAAAKIKEGFLANQFVCGMPDKIKIVTMGNYVIYAYGEAGIVDSVMNQVAALESATVVADENYQQ